MRCIVCFENLLKLESIWDIIGCPDEDELLLCTQCRLKLEPLSSMNDTSCQFCMNTYEVNENRVCFDCERWHLKLDFYFCHRALYEYNTFAKSLVWKIKHNHDIALIELISRLLKEYLLSTYDMNKVTFIPFPSDESTISNRGTHLTAVILRRTGVHVVPLFKNFAIKEKQHKHNRKERLDIAFQKLTIHQELLCELRSHVVLFDDIFTTGATMASGYRALSRVKSIKMESLSFFR